MSASQDEWGDYMPYTPESQDYLFAEIKIHDSRLKYHNDLHTITQFQTDYGRWITMYPTRMRKRFESQEEIRTFVLQLVSDISNLFLHLWNK